VTHHAVDVAVVGAGPYGLSLAAHLEPAGLSQRVFGHPMGFWRHHMPEGMLLKSEPGASSLSDPMRAGSVAAFCHAAGREYADCGVPLSRGTFLEYGQWFQQFHCLQVEPVLVSDVSRDSRGFDVALADGGRVRARSIVVATGLQHFAHVPRVLAELPAESISHSCAHNDLGEFAGRDVAIAGAGQSALECAALLAESGARVQVIARCPSLQWNGVPPPASRPLARRLREPQAALGSGWQTWFYCNHPELFRHLPVAHRIHRARTAIGPAGAWWLRPRVEGRLTVHLGRRIVAAATTGSRVRLRTRDGEGGEADLVVDHVIAATGYRPDVTRIPFLRPELASRVHTRMGIPEVNATFESSVSGLFFIGPIVASTFGPAMRFVWGADFAARVLAHRLAAIAGARHRRALRGPV
jgi:FAD-dependent urate hydroxylase